MADQVAVCPVIAESTRGLPDPRRYGPGDGRDPLVELAASSALGGRAGNGDAEPAGGSAADAKIRSILERAPTRHPSADMAGADAPDGALRNAGEAVCGCVFAIPLVIVSGARAAASLPGVLPDVPALDGRCWATARSGRAGHVGSGKRPARWKPSSGWRPARYSTLECDRHPGASLARAGAGGRAAGERKPICASCWRGGRPRAAPTIIETGAQIGAWGMPFARALGAAACRCRRGAARVAAGAVGGIAGGARGRCAQLEIAFDLFMSNAISVFARRRGIGRGDTCTKSGKWPGNGANCAEPELGVRRDLARRLLVSVLVAYAGVLVLVFLFQSQLVYFPNVGREVTVTPQSYGLRSRR